MANAGGELRQERTLENWVSLRSWLPCLAVDELAADDQSHRALAARPLPFVCSSGVVSGWKCVRQSCGMSRFARSNSAQVDRLLDSGVQSVEVVRAIKSKLSSV